MSGHLISPRCSLRIRGAVVGSCRAVIRRASQELGERSGVRSGRERTGAGSGQRTAPRGGGLSDGRCGVRWVPVSQEGAAGDGWSGGGKPRLLRPNSASVSTPCVLRSPRSFNWAILLFMPSAGGAADPARRLRWLRCCSRRLLTDSWPARAEQAGGRAGTRRHCTSEQPGRDRISTHPFAAGAPAAPRQRDTGRRAGPVTLSAVRRTPRGRPGQGTRRCDGPAGGRRRR